MTDNVLSEFLRNLAKRRKELKMPLRALVRRSGVSRPTVCRLLRGDCANVSFLKVAALAEALGVALDFRHAPVDEVVEKQAECQARRLVGMLQGTMGLEAQALPPHHADSLIEQSRQRLLSGPRKKLWS